MQKCIGVYCRRLLYDIKIFIISLIEEQCMNKSNKMDKESAAFTISGNEISCFFVLLPFQFLIVSYFFGLTNKSTLPNYVSDFLSIEFFAEASIEHFLEVIWCSFCVSIVLHNIIIDNKKEFCKNLFSGSKCIINFIYVCICIIIFMMYLLGCELTFCIITYIVCICFCYIPISIDGFSRFVLLMFLTTLFICIINSYRFRNNYVKIDKQYIIVTNTGDKIILDKCMRLGDFIYIDKDKPLVPISQVVKIQPLDN